MCVCLFFPGYAHSAHNVYDNPSYLFSLRVYRFRQFWIYSFFSSPPSTIISTVILVTLDWKRRIRFLFCLEFIRFYCLITFGASVCLKCRARLRVEGGHDDDGPKSRFRLQKKTHTQKTREEVTCEQIVSVSSFLMFWPNRSLTLLAFDHTRAYVSSLLRPAVAQIK